MKKLAIVLAVVFTMGLASSSVSAAVKDDKAKKECCAKAGDKACCKKDAKACTAKDAKACTAKPAEGTK